MNPFAKKQSTHRFRVPLAINTHLVLYGRITQFLCACQYVETIYRRMEHIQTMRCFLPKSEHQNNEETVIVGICWHEVSRRMEVAPNSMNVQKNAGMVQFSYSTER